ncbi:hypothetical protein D4R89_04185 [bacterium]|jgi:hypothetical protein|nr:MAG: hypothetical protein D4R89_04185 [bacterium]
MKPTDLEYDHRCLEDYFFNEFLPDDFTRRGEDEDAAREAMFDKLSKLAEVVEDVKKGLRKRK